MKCRGIEKVFSKSVFHLNATTDYILQYL